MNKAKLVLPFPPLPSSFEPPINEEAKWTSKRKKNLEKGAKQVHACGIPGTKTKASMVAHVWCRFSGLSYHFGVKIVFVAKMVGGRRSFY